MDYTENLTPTWRDIISATPRNLPQNLVELAYRDLNHYSTTQYQLLREDFVSSLREGFKLLRRFLQSGDKTCKNKANSFIAFYPKAELNKMTGATLHLKMPTNGSQNNDKALTPLSLLYLSTNNFKSITTGIIEDVVDGVVMVRLKDIAKITLHPTVKIDVIENKAYYLAYRPYMSCLQLMENNWNSSALVEYILGQNTVASLPRYIKPKTTYDLTSGNKVGNGKCLVLNINMWQSAKELGLNENQRSALHHALTTDIAIIQGPPGTGKTFLGVKIVQMLIKNQQVWQNEGPLLLVCFTNHALDQFLEKVIDDIGLNTGQLVRFGSRSESERLQPYNIQCLRGKGRVKSNLNKFYGHKRNIEKRQTAALEAMLSAQAKANRKIIQLPYLEEYMTDQQHSSLLNRLDEEDQACPMIVWLGEALFDMIAARAIGSEVGCSEYRLQVESGKVPGKKGRKNADNECEDIIGQLSDAGWPVGNLKRQLKTTFNGIMEKDDKKYVMADDVWNLDSEQRWRLYLSWVDRWMQKFRSTVQRLTDEYEENEFQLTEERANRDADLLQQALIIGMTTTGAALNKPLLDLIRPGIVIVEEAAEVTESHVVTALTEHCKHLIMIGDHKQLKPHTNCHELAINNNTEISFFERMIRNGVPYITLTVQHRMRPRIAQLLVPNIYKKLESHASVYQYEDIKGIESSVFFLDHKFDFQDKKAANSTSFVNEQEAQFVVALCRYLLQQNYHASKMTILSVYKGQMERMQSIANESTIFQDVTITTVDNYQGEENDIIILSLVRSNFQSKAGFLTIENRVCVALSRARMGLYVVGNFKMLNKVKVWTPILQALKKDRLVGPTLRIFCQNHPQIMFNVRVAKDFKQVPNGGCGRPCEYVYPDCRHRCLLLCHHVDMEHVRTCGVKCPKKCLRGHGCPKTCGETCGGCSTFVTVTHPVCKHQMNVKCSDLSPGTDMSKLKCGTLVSVTGECGHQSTLPCYKARVEVKCEVKCTKNLSCGHRCRGTCHSCKAKDGVQVHEPCSERCCRTLICGHACGLICSDECTKCVSLCGLSCAHSICQKPCGVLCVPCMQPCAWNCPHHTCKRKCYQPCNRPPCNKKCLKSIHCGHPCVGLCGEKCPKKCRVCNATEFKSFPVSALFIELTDCGHMFPVDVIDSLMGCSAKKINMPIGYQKCPQCQTRIRNSTRYGNSVKECRELVFKVQEQLSFSYNTQKEVYEEFLLRPDVPGQSKLVTEVKECLRKMRPYVLSDTDKLNLGKVTKLVEAACVGPMEGKSVEGLSSWVQSWKAELEKSAFKRRNVQEFYLRLMKVRLRKQVLVIAEKNEFKGAAMTIFETLDKETVDKPFDKEVMDDMKVEVLQLAKVSKMVKSHTDTFLEDPTSLVFTLNSNGWKKCNADHLYQTGNGSEECAHCCHKSASKHCIVQ